MADKQPLSIEERNAILSSEVMQYTRQGYNLLNSTPTEAVVSKLKKQSTFWNVVLTLLTGGLWLIVIFLRLKPQRLLISVNEFGKVSVK